MRLPIVDAKKPEAVLSTFLFGWHLGEASTLYISEGFCFSYGITPDLMSKCPFHSTIEVRGRRTDQIPVMRTTHKLTVSFTLFFDEENQQMGLCVIGFTVW
jgi:hypothetical protein